MSTPITAPVALDRRRTSALGRLRTMALATALVCTASGAYASFASVVINGLFVSAIGVEGSFLFAPTDARSQAWDLQALTDGVLNDQKAGGVPTWAPVDQTAQGSQSRATVASSEDTDPLTQVPTPRFTLAATANHLATGQLYTALGNMITSGLFCFWDSGAAEPPVFDGTSAFCTGAGSLTFTLFYDLVVETSYGPPNSAYADIAVLASGVPDGLFFDFASTLANTGSKEDQFFTWTYDVVAGDSAFFFVAGTVVAEAVPEPGVLSLAALGLLGLALTRRRQGPTRSAA